MKQTIIPINIDRNVSKADYRDLVDKNHLLVTSFFYTFQGEGFYAGHPAVFLRLAGCNIGAKEDCPFCDTKFWYDKGTVWGIDALAEALNEAAKGKAKLLVITGGEPLLQTVVLKNLIELMHHKNQCYPSKWNIDKFQIETNGYFVKAEEFVSSSADVMVVISPKVAATKNAYIKPKQDWFDWAEYSKHVPHVLKYVLSADPESPYHTVPSEVLEKAHEYEVPLYVSAMAVYLKSYPDGRTSSIWDKEEIDQETTAANYKYTAQYALQHGLLVSYQSHLFGGVE